MKTYLTATLTVAAEARTDGLAEAINDALEFSGIDVAVQTLTLDSLTSRAKVIVVTVGYFDGKGTTVEPAEFVRLVRTWIADDHGIDCLGTSHHVWSS